MDKESDGSFMVDHSNSLSPVFEAMLEDTTLTDVQLVCEPDGETLFAHRAILAAWCKPFRAMFTNGMRETAECRVVLRDVDSEAMRLLLRYMYTGKVHVSMLRALCLLSVANRFGIICLKECCEQYVMRNVDVVNCCELYIAAERHACSCLQRLTHVFIVRNFEEVSLTEGFGLLALEVLQKTLSHDELSVSSEEIVFDAMSRWANGKNYNCAQFDSLLQLIRFPLMSSVYLATVVERSPIIARSVVMRDLLYEAYRHHAVGSAMVAPSGAPRMKERGRDVVLWGNGGNHGLLPLGRVDSSSVSISEHTIENIFQRDDTYWLPIDSQEAFVCIQFPHTYRITWLAFQNRHSHAFSFEIQISQSSPNSRQLLGINSPSHLRWQMIVPLTPSGAHKAVQEVDFSEQNILAERVRIVFKGRPHSSYNPSVYWLELRGRECFKFPCLS